jgi:hypothetical protein
MMNEDPLVQMLGVGVLLWLPGCVYYTWRGFKPAPARETIVRPVPQQMTTKQAA